MIRILVLCFCALAGPVLGQESWPSLFDVVGVAQNDSLNVRAEPSAGAGIVGEFAANARDIEVFGTDPSGNWARVNVFDVSGWVAIRFLERQADQTVPLPETLHCSGTEPFWSISAGTGGAIYKTMEGGISLFGHAFDAASSNRTDRFSRAFAGKSGGLFVTLANETCSDGMSDRTYGWSIDAILAKNGLTDATMLSGCCSLTQ